MGSTINKATSNADFAARVGCHFTMASRIRGGGRLPSAAMLNKIKNAFDLSDHKLAEMMLAHSAGKAAFGQWIRDNLFIPDAA